MTDKKKRAATIKLIDETLRNWALSLGCKHEWHADQDNDCNFCVKCGARQEIYTE